VENVAAAIVLALTESKAANRIYNLGEEVAHSEADWVRLIGEVTGWKGEIVPLPDERLPAHLRTPLDWKYELAMDTSRIRTELGYKETSSLEEALRRTSYWEQANPPDNTRDAGQFDYRAEDLALAGIV
jgi:nucleoside-diphosphate-sugar epimerase